MLIQPSLKFLLLRKSTKVQLLYPLATRIRAGAVDLHQSQPLSVHPRPAVGGAGGWRHLGLDCPVLEAVVSFTLHQLGCVLEM